ncbi:hypothetical protein AGLY_014507, partial [Aphis glycines]
ALANGHKKNPEYSLPPHHRCASHTLNLVATRDSEKALSDVMYKRQMRSTFAKMQGLWKKQSRTCVVTDIIQKYEAKVQHICDESDISRFDKNYLTFMIDYCKIMEPLSRTLDVFQEDKYMAIGYLIPSINWLKTKLTELSLASIVNVQPSNDEDFLFGGDYVEPFSEDRLSTYLVLQMIYVHKYMIK